MQKSNEHITEVFSPNETSEDLRTSFITLGEGYISKGFYTVAKNHQVEGAANQMIKVLFDSGDYKKLLQETIRLCSVGNSKILKWTSYFGYRNGNLELSICFAEKFEKTDAVINLGKLNASIEEKISELQQAFRKCALYQINQTSINIKNFFSSFRKEELSSVLKVKNAIKLFIHQENNITEHEKTEVLSLSRVFCMNKRECKKGLSFKQRFLFKQVR